MDRKLITENKPISSLKMKIRKTIKPGAISLIIGIMAFCCTNPGDQRIQSDGPEVVEFKVLPFDLSDVTLLDGPFKHATELNVKSLLNYEPDRLLAKFRSEAGLEPKAEHYHGWEDNTIAGHSLGHHLSACAMMYRTTGDERFLERVNYIVDELEECQLADEEGYLGAFPDGKRILEEEVGAGDVRSRGFDLNGIWVPYYTEHKVMAGLFDAYNLSGNEKALKINIRFADWLHTVVGELDDSTVQVMLHCEHGGINESLAELYAITQDEKYLEMSRIFHHRAILDSLAAGIDVLPGKHGNTQVPKLIGLARRYELTGDPVDRESAEFFWDRVVNHHSYVTGGHGNHEYFGPPDQLARRLSDGTTETCNIYNMLKLSRHLFLWEASAEVADYYERALFNQILSSQHPGDGRVIYNLSLEMGGHKVYQDPYWFTCCVGTGMENHSKYGQNIYYYNDRELYVSQFIASELNWEKKGLKITQSTAYPEEQGSRIKFECAQPVELDIMLRYPYWAEQGIEIMVNGKPKRVRQEPGSFVRISGTWTTEDMIEVKIPFSLRFEAMPDDPNRVAIMYGPLVMAGDLGEVEDSNAYDPMYVPILLTDARDPSLILEAAEGEINTFRTAGVGRPRDVILKPFYRTHERRYTVYWDVFDEAGWKEREAEYKAGLERKKKIEEMTIDFVQMGEMQPERDHNFDGERTYAREFRGKRMRSSRNGWFSVDMDVFKGQPMALVVEYWGGFPGSKTFDILVDGELLATENISNKKDGQFINEIYEIPDAMTVDRTYVKVTFKAHEGHMVGPIFSVRTIKR
jgi:DUF1680 family protein